MKKILALMLCFVMIFSLCALTSCMDDGDEATSTTGSSEQTPGSGNGDNRPTVDTLGGMTAEEAYAAALAQLAEFNNFTMVTTQDITMTVTGYGEMVMNQTVVTKMAGSNVYIKTENDMEPTAEMECWFVNDWFYAISQGVSFKANITYAEFMEKYGPDASADSMLIGFPAEWFKDIKFYVDGDSYYIELVMSSEEYLNYVDNTTGMDISSADDIVYKVYFDAEGNLGDVITEFDFTANGVVCSVMSVSVISDVDTTEIAAPANGDSFIDVTGQI